MTLQSNVAGLAGRGDTGKSKAVGAQIYLPQTKTATEIATLIVAARFRLSPRVARLVCHLAGIGDAQ